ncbi:MAG TPA: hypothetical protein VGT79_00220, partial [Xanthomonadaceae bacterium]|nr:hypothetical protein [Xanthomonadaceae bacterium]
MKIASAVVVATLLLIASIVPSFGKPADTSPKEPAKQAQSAPWLAASPLVAPPLIGTVHFGKKPAAARPPSPIDGIREFAIDDRGSFGLLKLDSFMLVDRDGKVLRTIALPKLQWEFLHAQLAWLGGDRWIVIGSTRDKANAFWLDAKDGTVTPVAGFEMPEIARVASSHDGGFVVMTVTEKQEPMSQDFPAVLIKFTTFYQTLVVFDGQGR